MTDTRKSTFTVWTAAFFAGVLGYTGCGGGDIAATTSYSVESIPARLLLEPPVVQRLQQRAAAGDAAWTTLRSRCDRIAGGSFSAPNGEAYPNNGTGPGYQGDEYHQAVRNLGLCYRIVRGVDTAAEQRYGAAGGRLLDAMSTPVGQGGQPYATDSGYGIRNFGVGMALGYDWFRPALSQATKQRVINSLNGWIDWYDQSGFLRSDPIGNYFVGYFHAKTLASLATEGDNPRATGYWNDVVNRLWGQLVRPAYQTKMAGGGWPEGFVYGPLAIRSMAEAMWAVKTAKNLNWGAEAPIARDQAVYVRYFAWPSLRHMDDQNMVRSGNDELRPSATLYGSLAMMLDYQGDASSGKARSFANDVISAGGAPAEPWAGMLYWDASLSRPSFKSDSLSYFAKGPNHVGMRSTWERDAVWGSFAGGAYIAAKPSGEQYFNQGSLTVVQGDTPILINPTGWLPQKRGTPGEEFAYDDAWGNRARKLYNIFYVNDSSNIYNPGQASMDPTEARTQVDRYEDRTGYVRSRAINIGDMYRSSGSGKPVRQFSRDVVYVRPGIFVMHDQTSVASGGADQWMAFHTAFQPTLVGTGDSSVRYDIRNGGSTVGSLRSLLPRNTRGQVVNLMSGAAYRIEAHTPAPAAEGEWLSVLSVGGGVPEQTRLSSGDGNVTAGNVSGVHIRTAPSETVVLFGNTTAGQAAPSSVDYVVSQSGQANHIVADLAPSSSGYGVTASASGGRVTVRIRQGGSFPLSSGGTISFVVSASGAVSQANWPTVSSSSPSSQPNSPPPSAPAPSAPAPSAPAPSAPAPSAPAPSAPKPSAPAPSAPAPSAPVPTAPAPSAPSAQSGRDTISFQQGVNGYTGFVDASICSIYYSQRNARGVTEKVESVTGAGTVSQSNYAKKTLLKFNLWAIPTNAKVVSAVLEITAEAWSGWTMTGQYLAVPWNYYSNRLGWTNRTDSETWSAPGAGEGDVLPGKSFSTVLSPNGFQRVRVALDAGLVQSWITNPAGNNGMLITTTANNTLVRFHSSENASVAQRPKLTIVYDVP